MTHDPLAAAPEDEIRAEAKPAQSSDQEINALAAITRYLAKMSQPERERTMRYLNDRFAPPA